MAHHYCWSFSCVQTNENCFGWSAEVNIKHFLHNSRPWGTGISGLTIGLATLPQGGSRSLQWSETGMEDPPPVHCFCVCSGSALLGDLLGVSRSRERDLPSVLSIYLGIFLLWVFIVYRRVVRFLCLSAICWCVLVALAIERPLWWHLHEVRRLSEQSPGGRACLCAFFFHSVCLCCYVFRPAPHNIYFIPLWHDIAYMCWMCR